MSTPEIDPAGAMAGFTLLAGGLAVLRGRRSKK
jgi:LPXTG-motif cell wall-anchored protein